MGKVYLVGAGCGAIDSYTLKAMECVKKADCLIYDHLIDERVLNYCKDDCEKIYVGKKAHHHVMKQEEIQLLLIHKAKQYQNVVRLKGGDVYVFGRGGEEGKVLFENHIDFEVIPGVSSVTAGLAYAGIPVTHRGLSGGFQVYTGQLKYNQKREFDFTTMLDDYCTYIFLMSIAKLDDIIEGFLKSGKDEKTPVAVICNASLPYQRCLVGTLSDIQERFHQDPLPTPGIIVVGNVVKMRKYLNFYETKPLFSKKILVTSINHDDYLFQRLNELGAHVHQVMTGDIVYKDVKIPRMKGYLIFTSRHGVIGFMKNFLKQYKDLRLLADIKIICIGKKTNEVLNHYGLNADIMPSHSDSDYINNEFKEIVKGQDVYLVQGENTTDIKIHTHLLSVYKNQETKINQGFDHYDYGLFTCASSVRRYYKVNQSVIDIFISIGAHTTKVIQECYGNVRIIEVKQASKDEMIKEILRSEDNVL